MNQILYEMLFYTLIGFILFFLIIFAVFTIIPRIVLAFIMRLLEFKHSEKFKHFYKNCRNMLGIYFVLGIPLTIIFYQVLVLVTPNANNPPFNLSIQITSFITIFILLIAIRLSILLKKRHILRKVGLSFLTKLDFEKINKKELRIEYTSYLFSIFFSSFFIGILVFLFKVFTSPESLFFVFPSIKLNFLEIITKFGRYFIYLLILFMGVMASEGLLELCGGYKIEVKKE